MIVFAEKVAVTPVGSPVGVPIPVAKVVLKVIVGEIAVLMQIAGLEEAALTVFISDTVIVPVALTNPQPPVSGIE